jgi:hypothetical protein
VELIELPTGVAVIAIDPNAVIRQTDDRRSRPGHSLRHRAPNCYWFETESDFAFVELWRVLLPGGCPPQLALAVTADGPMLKTTPQSLLQFDPLQDFQSAR